MNHISYLAKCVVFVTALQCNTLQRGVIMYCTVMHRINTVVKCTNILTAFEMYDTCGNVLPFQNVIRVCMYWFSENYGQFTVEVHSFSAYINCFTESKWFNNRQLEFSITVQHLNTIGYCLLANYWFNHHYPRAVGPKRHAFTSAIMQYVSWKEDVKLHTLLPGSILRSHHPK